MSDSPLFTWRGAVCDCQSLKSTTRHVLLTIATHMNGRGEGAYPTVDQLVYETGLSNRTICTHIELAAEAGWIRKKRHGFAGQKWANHEYEPAVPKGHKRVTFTEHKKQKGSEPLAEGSERGSLPLDEKVVNLTTEGSEPLAEGSEPNDIKVVKEVHCSSSYSSSNSSSVVEKEKGNSHSSGTPSPEDTHDHPDEMLTLLSTLMATHRKYGGQCSPSKVSTEFKRRVWKVGRCDEFLIAYQNLLNRKDKDGTALPRFENYIRGDDWEGDLELAAGSIHVPGAPAPSPHKPKARPQQETAADIAKRISDNFHAKQKTLEHES